jgi:hypothetical protein
MSKQDKSNLSEQYHITCLDLNESLQKIFLLEKLVRTEIDNMNRLIRKRDALRRLDR